MSVITYKKNTKLSDHFNSKEFKSPDNVKVLISESLVNKLEKLFKYKIDSITITSGYRTPKYSVSVGGYANDAHTKGIAADIIAYKKGKALDSKLLACLAQEAGFSGIGIIDGTAIHVDVRNAKNYTNAHWFGDERTGNDNIADFYKYYGKTKAQVFGKLGYYKERVALLKTKKKSTIYAKPLLTSDKVKTYEKGKKARVFAEKDGFYKTVTGWIKKDNCNLI